LPRAALAAKLGEALDHRLTLVQAGTGCGKSTALAMLAQDETPLFWYSITEADVDPQQFLAYLIGAFRLRLPDLSDLPLTLLQEYSVVPHRQDSRAVWSRALDALVNALTESLPGPSLLVLDDYHLVAHSKEINALTEQFITYMPPDLHVILSSRYPLLSDKSVASGGAWSQLARWRARGEVLEIDRETLAFRRSEIEALFRDSYGMRLAPEDIAALAEKTEGWPIALQLVWQGLRNNRARKVSELLEQGPASLTALFDYLARDVLERQPPEIAAFLRDTAVLRELTPAACQAVTASPDSATLLERVHHLNLFVVALDEGHYRYHHLFHDFLRQQSEADAESNRERHRRAAQFFNEGHQYDEAIYHWLAAGDFSQAATAMELAADATLRAARLDTLARWIDALPPEVLGDHPQLQAALGDVYRLRSRFDEALAWYVQAEQTWRARSDPAGISRALRGQALIYLDTVRPAQAESLLEEALRISDGLEDRRARARLLELLAENKLNMGQPEQAEALRAEARALRETGPSEDVLSVRVRLRTGRLDEAQQVLEAWLEEERREADRGHVHPPRAHRETVLLLSLIHSFRGQADQAIALAQEGIALGERLNAPFVTAVAHTRLGHALQLQPTETWPPETAQSTASRDDAIRRYETAIALGDRLAVRRMRVEVMWGLTRAYGFFGDLESARRAAAEGVEIGRWAGDAWVTALIELVLAASTFLSGHVEEAVEALTRVLIAFRECGDRFGRAATRLWLSLAYLNLQQEELFAASVEDLLTLCETNAYDFLFTRPTLLGPPDPRRLVPLLIAARERSLRSAYATRLLADIGLPEIQIHPGYQLRVQTLGDFRAWRGQSVASEIKPREWRRDKARQLFQLLLTHRRRWLQREEIVELLWPDLSPEAAGRDFKVALNALNRAIEPARSSDAPLRAAQGKPFAFIAREGTAYRLRPEADVWLDAAAFEQECETGLRFIKHEMRDEGIAHLRSGLRLYHGDYLPEALYEDWASEERERLLSLYLRAADRLAEVLLEQGQYDEAIQWCERILTRDVCWESAYRTIMSALAQQGNRPQAFRVYQRCVNALREELDVAPSPATIALHERIVRSDGAIL